jgi:TRAP-type mannitol/chloroaromatic compound transport system substrate-binding protein
MSWKAQDRYSSDLIEMTTKQAVKAVKTPDSVLEAQLQAWDKVIAAQSQEPFFKRVIDSQKAWVQRVSGFFNQYDADLKMSYRHFFTS